MLELSILKTQDRKPAGNMLVLCNWGMTLKQSSAVHIQALVSADGILLGSSSKLRLLVINLASVPGGQLVNSPTAQSLERCLRPLVPDKRKCRINNFRFLWITQGFSQQAVNGLHIIGRNGWTR